jgi:transglutaminase-like putative cysteine protease
MRIRISHATAYAYDHRPRSIVQVLRLTPRAYEGQHVVGWRVETDADVSLRAGEDAFGNITHTLFTDQPLERLTVAVMGEVETFDAGGVVRGAVERHAPPVYLRDTPLTEIGPELAAFTDEIAAAHSDPLDRLHALLAALHRDVTFDTDATHSETTAVESFRLRRGVCQDLAHIFIAAARRMGAPARYVSGHLVREDTNEQEAAHAWAEAHVPGVGWIGFDPANGVCPTESYVRIATALDYLGAAPVRGARTGGGQERLSVRLNVSQAARPAQGQMGQSQSQS